MNSEIFDVVIIGSGFAGLSAAIEAAESCQNVLVLEKMKAPGGNSIISDGGIAAPNVDYQINAGISDSPDLMFQDMFNAGKCLGNPDLVRIITENAKDAFYWTRDYLGVEYLKKVEIFGGHSVPRCYTPVSVSGSLLIKKMLEKLKNLKVEIRCSSYVEKIITEKDNSVKGLIVLEDYFFGQEKPLKEKKIFAKKGIIISTGGFAGDVDFRKKYNKKLGEDIKSTNKVSTTAEVLKECMRIGASTVHLDKIQLGPWACPDETGYGVGPLFADYIALPYGIVVETEKGSRFANELLDRDSFSTEILKQKFPVIGIADSGAVIRSGFDISKAINKNIVKIFNNIEELALSYQIKPEDLKKTIDRYNEMIDFGKDLDHGKKFFKGSQRIEESPFYAMKIWPKIHYTMGGLEIDRNCRVLGADKKPIKGLFAAGEVTGGIHGAARLGSCAITDCIVMGRIAGSEASRKDEA